MLPYMLKRIFFMIPVLLAISLLSYMIIQLPPGDFVDAYIRGERGRGRSISSEEEASLRVRFGVNDPFLVQYARWMSGIVRGDLGYSLAMKESVSKIVAERLPLTVLISLLSFLLINLIAIPIGMLSATRQYSVADYFFSALGFLGMGVPQFIFAVVMLWSVYSLTGKASVGVTSPEFVGQPMSLAKFADMVGHLWLPALIAAATGTAGTIRIIRANLLDEMEKPYVIVARAKGLPRTRMLYKYPFRMALNPFIVGLAGVLPGLVSGELMVSITLGIPTLAPVLLQALQMQDVETAGTLVFIISTLSVVGIFFSDILLAIVDPRIRYD